MENQLFINRISKDLYKKGLPLGYIKRIRFELEDHLQDIKDSALNRFDLEDKLEAFKNHEQIVASTYHHFKSSHFVFRHPVLTSLLFPTPLFLSAFILFNIIFIWIGLKSLHYFGFDQSSSALSFVVGSIYYISVYGLTSIIPAYLCYIAYNNGLNKIWTSFGCLSISLINFFVYTYYKAPVDGPGSGVLRYAFGFNFENLPGIFFPLIILSIYMTFNYFSHLTFKRKHILATS